MLLRPTSYPRSCLLFHQRAITGSSVWLCHCKNDFNPSQISFSLTSHRVQLWCWISLPWEYLRIAVFYGPVWLVIFLTFAIYLRVGSVIYQKHRQLRFAGAIESTYSDLQHSISRRKLSGIHVTREIACSSPVSASFSMSGSHPARSQTMSNFSPYSVTIEGGCSGSVTKAQNRPSSPCSVQEFSPWPGPENPPAETELTPMHSLRRDSLVWRKAKAENFASWIYTKYAILFFVALLATWVRLPLPLEMTDSHWQSQVPSTANRVYTLIRPDDFCFGLNYVSSFVLPLQGFWNSLIYVSISWPAFKSLGAELQYRVEFARAGETGT